MEFNKLISDFENSLKQEREWNEQSEKRIQELEWENMGLQTSVTRLENIIKDEHPEIQRLIEVLKSKGDRLRDINKELSKKDAEIQRLKEELAKSEKFTSEHIGFLMEALKREPIRVVIEEKTNKLIANEGGGYLSVIGCRTRAHAPFRKSISMSREYVCRATELERVFTEKYPNECPFSFSKTVSKALETVYFAINNTHDNHRGNCGEEKED